MAVLLLGWVGVSRSLVKKETFRLLMDALLMSSPFPVSFYFQNLFLLCFFRDWLVGKREKQASFI